MLAPISEIVFRHVSKCVTATKIRESLQNYFIAESKVRIVQLKTTLQTMKKGSLSIHEYISHMIEVFDAPVSSGQSISEDELINFVINGLGPEYDPVIVLIMPRLDYARINLSQGFGFDIHGGIVNLANKVKNSSMRNWSGGAERNASVIGLFSSLNEAAGRNMNDQYVETEVRGNRFTGANQRLSRRGFGGVQTGRGRSRSFSKPKIMCQLCGKAGHVAMKCYHRFDITFMDNS